MSADAKPKSQHYQQYVELRCQLHLLIAKGQIDSPEADEVREALMVPWRLLSEADLDELDFMAEDLLSLEDQLSLAPLSPTQQPGWGQQLQAAAADSDFQGLLTLLRQHQDALAPDRVAYLRAWAWYKLAQPQPAALFLQGAVQLGLAGCVKASAQAAAAPLLTPQPTAPLPAAPSLGPAKAQPTKEAAPKSASFFMPPKLPLRPPIQKAA